ncbi:hypothetical protein L1887_18927 [Cichorium endivia]|nr:hypothetical protein L1887_18927 [Cichorium endivia]
MLVISYTKVQLFVFSSFKSTDQSNSHKSAVGFPYSTKSANLALILISKQKELSVESSREISVGEFETKKLEELFLRDVAGFES